MTSGATSSLHALGHGIAVGSAFSLVMIRLAVSRSNRADSDERCSSSLSAEDNCVYEFSLHNYQRIAKS